MDQETAVEGKDQRTREEKERFQQRVAEARELLEFAIAEGRSVEDRIVEKIKEVEDLLLQDQVPSDKQRADLEKTYRDLAQFLAPVTVHTLQATSDENGRKVFLLTGRQKRSEAKIWSRKLWVLTTLFVLLALFGENLDRILTQFFPVDEETEGSILKWQIVSSVFQALVPFTYGAIGSFAYLLRSCHEHIYKRQFDPNRIPEYYNRILLGIVSGGAILLFIEQVTTDQGAIKISAAALAFLAGYNTDFLFTTIERVTAAILPKVGLETVRRAPSASAPLSPVSLENLLERRDKAQLPEEKKFFEDLINKLAERR